jgi:hypothetical protein
VAATHRSAAARSIRRLQFYFRCNALDRHLQCFFYSVGDHALPVGRELIEAAEVIKALVDCKFHPCHDDVMSAGNLRWIVLPFVPVIAAHLVLTWVPVHLRIRIDQDLINCKDTDVLMCSPFVFTANRSTDETADSSRTKRMQCPETVVVVDIKLFQYHLVRNDRG